MVKAGILYQYISCRSYRQERQALVYYKSSNVGSIYPPKRPPLVFLRQHTLTLHTDFSMFEIKANKKLSLQCILMLVRLQEEQTGKTSRNRGPGTGELDGGVDALLSGGRGRARAHDGAVGSGGGSSRRRA